MNIWQDRAKNEINQPMYATSVGLIMRGFEYLETYKKTFNAGTTEEFVKPKTAVVSQNDEEEEEADILHLNLFMRRKKYL